MLFRKLLIALVASFSLALPAWAEDAPAVDPQLARIAAMPIKELDAFINGVAAAVSQDAVRLKGFAQANACLELIRAANSLALASTYLGQVRDTATERPEPDGKRLAAKAIQVRVVAFASRIRTEEWLNQICRGFTVPADKAADQRYQQPPKVANAEYTEAVIEARQAAETNLAIAVNAGIADKCPEAIVAGQNISLLLPYLDKLLSDTASRPEVLGPRASRRGLEVSRRQLVTALDKLQSQFGEKCQAPEPGPDADAPEAAPKPAE